MNAVNQKSTPVMQGLVRPVLVSAVFFMLLTGLAYPLPTTGVAQLLFPDQANSSLIVRDGTMIGSAVIGQNFSKLRYFHPRPSTTTGTDPASESRQSPNRTTRRSAPAAISGPPARS